MYSPYRKAQVQTSSLSTLPEPDVISRSDHCVSRKSISSNALKVLYRLNEAGFASYLVGGGVRDLLLERHPKDFDIATDASPEEVKELFRNCRLIGRRFRLAHVVFGREIIEVATFRADHSDGDGGATGESGRIVRDNVFGGSLAEDAVRRDFTVNALYYNIADFSVVDFYGGLDDIEDRRLRFIGNASDRVVEDPVRALRAVRFAAKLEFSVDATVADAIEQHRHLLQEIPAARLFEEVLKLLQSGDGQRSFEMLREFDLLKYLFPLTAKRLSAGDAYAQALADLALRNTDKRIRDEQPVTPAFIYAVLLWPDVVERAAEHESAGEASIAALHLAADEIIPIQLDATSLPRRYSVPMREIWALQPRLLKARGKRADSLLGNPRFRAAYDFLCLRNDAGEDLESICTRWEELQQSPESQALIEAARKQPRPAAPRRRRRRSQGSQG